MECVMLCSVAKVYVQLVLFSSYVSLILHTKVH